MTFASETVRILFHQLPTERQVTLSDLEADLLKKGLKVHVDAVMHFGVHSEIVIRVLNDFNYGTVGSHDLRSD